MNKIQKLTQLKKEQNLRPINGFLFVVIFFHEGALFVFFSFHFLINAITTVLTFPGKHLPYVLKK